MEQGIFELPEDLKNKLEEIRELRRQVAEHYFKTGGVKEQAIARIRVILEQTATALFKHYPVLFMQRETYVMPAPATVKEIKFLEKEGFTLVIPEQLQGKSLEEIAEIQKENLQKYFTIFHHFAVDADFMVFLEAHFRAKQAQESQEQNEFIDEKFELDAGVEVKKDEYTEAQESGKFVSENISKRRKRKASEAP